MDLSKLDREQLEAILLDPPGRGTGPLRCSEPDLVEQLPRPRSERSARLRHVLAAAHELLVRIAHRAIDGRCVMNSPELVKQFLNIQFAGAERETFVVIFLDAQMGVIAAEEMFTGTLTQTSVYPREIVRRALQLNAGSVICAHPHPSGQAEPSRSDEYLTQSLKTALAVVDIRLLDHIVVGGGTCVSFAERGLL
jgi:DNA repair protein RadC